LAGVQHAVAFGFALPQRVFGLDRGDGEHGVRPPIVLRPGLGEPEVQNLARVDEFLTAPATSSMGTFGSTRCW